MSECSLVCFFVSNIYVVMTSVRIDSKGCLCGLQRCLGVAMAVMSVYGQAEASNNADGLTGLCGEELKRAVQVCYSPTDYVTKYLGEGGRMDALMQSDVAEDGVSFVNRFSSVKLHFPQSLTVGCDAMFVNVVCFAWWDAFSEQKKWVEADLYNIVPTDAEVGQLKGAYPPGIVTKPSFSNDFWSVGSGVFGGQVCTFWQPPKGYEGDVARVLFYVLSVYADELKPFEALVDYYVTGEFYPGFSESAIRQLLTWHRADPVDAIEQQRNEIFAKAQGNVNPYVEYVSLAEHVWGNRKTMPFEFGDDDVDENVVKVPLKSKYSITDKRIDLQSVYVSEGALWTLDGVRINADFVEPASLGVGVHELRFETETENGKLLIEIVP